MTHVRVITFSLCDSSRKLNLGWVVWNLNVLLWRQCWQPTLFPALFHRRWLFHQDLFSTGGTAYNEITRLVFPAVLWFTWGGEINLFGKTAITWGVGDGKHPLKDFLEGNFVHMVELFQESPFKRKKKSLVLYRIPGRIFTSQTWNIFVAINL